MRAAKHPHLYVPDLRHKCCCDSVGFFRQHVEEAPSSWWGALQQQICKDHAWKQHSTAQHSTQVGYSNQLACNWCWALKLAYLAGAAFAHLMILFNNIEYLHEHLALAGLWAGCHRLSAECDSTAPCPEVTTGEEGNTGEGAADPRS